MTAAERLARELLQQSRQLATKEPQRPRQASLRRAVSSAYYALFHFLIDQATRQLIGASAARAHERHVLARAFSHGEMLHVSRQVADQGRLPANVAPGLGNAAVPAILRDIATTFRDLQEERHNADYNLLDQFTKTDVLESIERVEEAFDQYPRIAGTEETRRYLLALLVGQRVRS